MYMKIYNSCIDQDFMYLVDLLIYAIQLYLQLGGFLLPTNLALSNVALQIKAIHVCHAAQMNLILHHFCS